MREIRRSWHHKNDGTCCNITKSISWIILFITLLSSCSTLEIPEYPVASAASYPDSNSNNGLVVAVKPILDREESEKYFGVDLIASNILAILVIAENHNPSDSFIIDDQNISLVNYTKKEYSNHITDRDSGDGVAVGTAGGILLSPALLMGGLKMISDAGMIQYNFESKALKPHTLSPGGSTSGFVYFQIPKTQFQKTLSIHVEASNLHSKKMENFTLVVSRGIQ